MILLLAIALLLLLGVLLLLLALTRNPPGARGERHLIYPAGNVRPPLQPFRWHPVEGADRFDLELVDDQGRVLTRETTADTTFLLPADLHLDARRAYRWRITYRFPDGVSLRGDDLSFFIVPTAPDDR